MKKVLLLLVMLFGLALAIPTTPEIRKAVGLEPLPKELQGTLVTFMTEMVTDEGRTCEEIGGGFKVAPFDVDMLQRLKAYFSGWGEVSFGGPYDLENIEAIDLFNNIWYVRAVYTTDDPFMYVVFWCGDGVK